MSLYTLSYRVDGYVDLDIEADSRSQAMDSGAMIMEELDFGLLTDIDYELGRITDPKNRCYYEGEFDDLIDDEKERDNE